MTFVKDIYFKGCTQTTFNLNDIFRWNFTKMKFVKEISLKWSLCMKFILREVLKRNFVEMSLMQDISLKWHYKVNLSQIMYAKRIFLIFDLNDDCGGNFTQMRFNKEISFKLHFPGKFYSNDFFHENVSRDRFQTFFSEMTIVKEISNYIFIWRLWSKFILE